MFRAFYSDPHFGHASIIGFADRPYTNVEAMDRDLIARYNDVICCTDTVLWLGDCFLGGDKWRHVDILRALNGHKVLLRGNHDGTVKRMATVGFDFVTDRATIPIAGRTARVSHFPSKSPLADGDVLIHGHTHRPERRVRNRIHVGVDAWNLAPAMWDDVVALVKEV